MPLFNVDKANINLQLIRPSSFVDEHILERKDLQPLLRENPFCIDPDLFILAEEFGNWEGSFRRIALLGLDPQGNLVVIELKRVEDGSHMELQFLRYAAMLSVLDLNAAVEIHETYLKRQNKNSAEARQSITEFLKTGGTDNIVISNRPRIVLVAPGFSREITTTVLWLNEIGLDIRCLEAKLYNMNENLYLDMEQVIPLPSAQDYMFSLRKKAVEVKAQTTITRNERALNRLITDGVLKSGMRVRLIRSPRPGMTISDDKAKSAIYKSEGVQGFEWDFDGKSYSLSGLTRAVCLAFGGNKGSGAFAGPEYWAIENETVSLAERAKKLTES